MPTQILYLSSADFMKAATLQSRIEELQTALAKLLGGGAADTTGPTKGGRGRMSTAQREKLSKAAKARWKKAKAAGKSTL